MPTIERRLQQVDKYFITPNYIESESIDYFIKIENILEAGIKIIQFRSKNLNIEDYSRVSKKIYCLCRKYNSIFIINDFKNFNLNKYCDGIQLTSKNLKNINLVNFNKKYILIGSCHNVQEIEMCNNLQLNLILNFYNLSFLKNYVFCLKVQFKIIFFLKKRDIFDNFEYSFII